MIAVAGKNNIAVHALKILVDKIGAENVIAIPNDSDDGHDRFQQSLLKSALSQNVTIANLAAIQEKKDLDCFISLEFDKIVDPGKFNTKRLYNIHFSELPKYKGMYTSFWPIYNGDKSSGVTLHRIDRGIDTGYIIGQQQFLISDKDRCSDLYFKYIENAIDLFDRYIDELLTVEWAGSPQASVGSTYYSKKSVSYHDVKIDFFVTAWQLQRQVYAYSFRPYQLPILFGKKVTDVTITASPSKVKPGVILDESTNQSRVSTIDYDAIIHFDELDNILGHMNLLSIDDVKGRIKNISGIHDKNVYGWSLIIVAAYYGRLEIVDYLLSIGANINDTNFKGTTVLMYAKDSCLRSGSSTLFNYLLENGADIERKDLSGKKLVDYLSKSEVSFLGLSA